MSNFSRQVKRNQARRRKKEMKRRMNQNRQNESQMSEAMLWQNKYDAKVQEVAALRAEINKQEAIIAALILDNSEDNGMGFSEETIQFIAQGGVQGFNRELLDDGGIMLEVVLSPDAEEVEDDDASVDEAGTEDADGDEAEGSDPDDS